jgi:anaerobic selenocysteine-containing dehydrogenase
MRYKKRDGSPSMAYPRTASGKFEFRFSYLENINERFGTKNPVTFYWTPRKWDPGAAALSPLRRDFPYQLISGRAHHSMTMTQVCPLLGETETECMKPLNESFTDIILPPGNESGQSPSFSGILQSTVFKKDSFGIPTFAINQGDGEKLGLQRGELIILENPLGMRIRGKVFLTHEIRPGVIKTVFGAGGRSGSGMGLIRNTSDYTPNINELVDPGNINRLTGMPGFGDIMVRIIKHTREASES